MKRAIAILAAFVVGWFVYMIAMIMTVYDGLMSMILQPFIAAICSAIFVVPAILLGLALRLPFISRLWNVTTTWATALIACSLFVLCFGYQCGIVENYFDPETSHQFQGLHSAAAMGSYFTLLFAIANWPMRRATKTNDTADKQAG